MDNAKRKRYTILAFLAMVVIAGSMFALALLLKSNGPSTGPVATVVVATKVIPAGTAITTDEIGLQQVPLNVIPTNSFYTDPAKVTGQFAVVALAPNTIISGSSVVSDTSQIAAGGVTVITLQPGYVAVSVPYSATTGVGGYLKAGDRIDIAVDVTGADNIKFAFQDVSILRVGAVGQVGAGANQLVLSLPRGEAKALLALTNEGTTTTTLPGTAKATLTTPGPKIVAFVLRASGDKGFVDSTAYLTPPQEQAVGPNDLKNIFGP